MIIGKTFTFEAAHHLEGHKKCGQIHGHTYRVTIEVQGPIVLSTGMVMDLHHLSEIVHNTIDIWDHSCMDNFFSIPTCEKICEALALRVQELLPVGVLLYSTKIQEGEGGYAIRMG